MSSPQAKGGFSPKEAYQEALNRIADVVEAAESVLVLENLGLDRIPGEIRDAENVSALHLKGNLITDLGPLAGLTNIRYLYLQDNFVVDLAPVATLPQLHTIDVSNNQLFSLEPLARCQALVELYAPNNKVEEVSPLAKLTGLKIIDLGYNSVKSAAALSELKQLKQLYLNDNKLIQLVGIEQLTELERLSISGNNLQASDLELLLGLEQLVDLGLDDLNLTELPEQLLMLPNLEVISLTGNPIANVPAEELNDLNQLRTYTNMYVQTAEPEDEQAGQQTSEADGAEGGTASQATPLAVFTRMLNIRTRPDEALLGVPAQAGIFAEMLYRAEVGSGEQFFGLFGRWGRGKSFFWEETQKYLRSKYPDSFEYVELHAWKYQDTPAVWAYLYELLVESYYDKRSEHPGWNIWKLYRGTYWRNLPKWMGYQVRKLRLNWQRGVTQRELIGFAGSVLAGVTTYFIGDSIHLSTESSGLLGSFVWISSFVFGVRELRKKYGTDARNLIRTATQNASFAQQLGFQHEVQNELNCLLKVWLPESKQQQQRKRVLLFIDDIDRCTESKIIQIVDAVRVMLHDPYIRDRVLVVAAIDERILLRAIGNKYSGVSDPEKRYQLSREYMDKLFIAGLRLGPLADHEKDEIFDGFTRKITNPKPRASRISTDSMLNQLQLHLDANKPADNAPDPMRLQPMPGTGPVPPKNSGSQQQATVQPSQKPGESIIEAVLREQPVADSKLEKIIIEAYRPALARTQEIYGGAEPLPVDSVAPVLARLLVRFHVNPNPVDFEAMCKAFSRSVGEFDPEKEPPADAPFALESQAQIAGIFCALDVVEQLIPWKPIESPWELEHEESNFLKDCLDHYADPTPRNIRVFTIRFLLGKKLMERELSPAQPGWAEWNHSFDGKQWFALMLVEYGSERRAKELDTTLQELQTTEDDVFRQECYGQTFELPVPFVVKAFKVLAMVITY